MREGSGWGLPPYRGEAADCAYIFGDPREAGGVGDSVRGGWHNRTSRAGAAAGSAGGSAAERRGLREVDRLRGSENGGPPARFLARLERLLRDFS